MKRLRFSLAAATFFALTSPAHAFLVNYEFQGIVTGSAVSWASAGDTMRGLLSFNPDGAAPADVENAPGTFDFGPGQIRLTVLIGPYTFDCNQTSAGATFGSGGFSMPEMIFDGENNWGRMHMGVDAKNLFKDQPIDSLAGGKWNKVKGGPGWSIETFNEEYAASVDGTFTSFRYVGGQPNLNLIADAGFNPVTGGPLDAAPNPEPATWLLMSAGLSAFGMARRRFKLAR